VALDEVSKTLGELVAGVESLRNQTKDQWEDLEEIKKLVGEVHEIREDVAAMKPHVEDYRRLKQRGLGVVALLGLMGTGVGVGLTKLIETMSNSQ
jgi:amino acid permease